MSRLRGQSLLPIDCGKMLKIFNCTSNILQIQLKVNLSCHGMQGVLEGGGTGGKETSWESHVVVVRGRLRLGKWLGKKYSEEKDSHQWW